MKTAEVVRGTAPLGKWDQSRISQTHELLTPLQCGVRWKYEARRCTFGLGSMGHCSTRCVRGDRVRANSTHSGRATAHRVPDEPRKIFQGRSSQTQRRIQRLSRKSGRVWLQLINPWGCALGIDHQHCPKWRLALLIGCRGTEAAERTISSNRIQGSEWWRLLGRRAQPGSMERGAARSRCHKLFKPLFNGSVPKEKLLSLQAACRALPRRRNDPEALLC